MLDVICDTQVACDTQKVKGIRWDDVILDIAERTIDEIEKYTNELPGKLKRQEIVINRIWCKALVKYLMRNKTWMAEEGNDQRLKLLSNFTQQLRRTVAKGFYTTFGAAATRGSDRYARKIERIKQGYVGEDNLGWSDPYRVLVAIMFDSQLINLVVGTTNFKYRDEIVELSK